MKNLSYFENINKIYFIGIGGISQSALACIMKANGFEVCGSDIVKSETTKKLESCRIKVNLKQKATNINQFKPDLVVYSGAIKKNNEELKQAKNLNIACLERSKFISKFLPFYKNVISISGTHGKSTTTCMISETFSLAGLNPTMHLGAESVNLNSNFLIGDNKFFINEACEYRKSFLDFKSTLGVILNIEEDHPDCYKDINEVNNAFSEFYNICEKVVINEGYVKNIENLIDNKTITFSLDKGTFVAKDIIINENGGTTFNVYKNNEFYSNITLNIFAKHNVYNALASIAVCDYFNIDKQIIDEAIKCVLKHSSNMQAYNNKIACFTEDIRAKHMWDNYGDGYSGFALEYNMKEFVCSGCGACHEIASCNKMEKNFSHVYPVIYTNQRFDATVNIVSIIFSHLLKNFGFPEMMLPIDNLFMYKSYLYKSSESYSQENEWRLICRCPAMESSEYASIPDRKSVKAIYYGPDIEERYKSHLRKVAQLRGLEEYEVSVDLDNPSFELKLTKL